MFNVKIILFISCLSKAKTIEMIRMTIDKKYMFVMLVPLAIVVSPADLFFQDMFFHAFLNFEKMLLQ